MMVFFSSQKITNHITRIYLPGDVQAYLVEGMDKSVLIDTGCGIGDLKAYVATLTASRLRFCLHTDISTMHPEPYSLTRYT